MTPATKAPSAVERPSNCISAEAARTVNSGGDDEHLALAEIADQPEEGRQDKAAGGDQADRSRATV